jgi:hypothetical protein
MPRADRFSLRNLPVGLLLGCALLMRVLVPAGWMPAAGQGLGIQICADGMDGAAAARFAADAQHRFDRALAGSAAGHDRDDGGDHRDKSQPCAFAGLALPWTGSEAPVLAAPLPPEPVFALPAAAPASIGRGLAAPPPPATGPPALS